MASVKDLADPKCSTCGGTGWYFLPRVEDLEKDICPCVDRGAENARHHAAWIESCRQRDRQAGNYESAEPGDPEPLEPTSWSEAAYREGPP